MTKVRLGSCFDYDGEQMARLTILDAEMEIPINISIGDNTEQNLTVGEVYDAEIWTDEYELSIHTPEDSLAQVGSKEPATLIPSGTFPADPNNKEFKENGMIIFTGVVRSIECYPDADEDDPKCKLTIEAYCLTFDLYYFGDDHVKVGYVIDGSCWLYGNLSKTA